VETKERIFRESFANVIHGLSKKVTPEKSDEIVNRVLREHLLKLGGNNYANLETAPTGRDDLGYCADNGSVNNNSQLIRSEFEILQD
jgi:hypothetical protein